MLTIHEAPATRVVVISPDNDEDLADTPRALWVGGGGALVLTALDDSAPVTIAAVPAGALLPIRVKRVLATGTTATAILGLF